MREVTAMDNTKLKAAVCPECGAELPENAAVCPVCGCPVKTEAAEEMKFCIECGAELSAGAAVCPNCGHPVVKPKAAVAAEVKTPAVNTPAVNIPAVSTAGKRKGIIAEGRSDPANRKKLMHLMIVNVIAALLFIIPFIFLLKTTSQFISDISAKLAGISDNINTMIDKVNNSTILSNIFGLHIDPIDLKEEFEDLIYNDVTLLMLPMGLSFIFFFADIPFAMAGLFYEYWRGYRITVQESGVIVGIMPFKATVFLAFNTISDVKTDIAGNIALYSEGKRYVFKDIENNEEVCQAINGLREKYGLL